MQDVDVVLSSYYTMKNDPLYKKHVDTDSHNYMLPWYETVKAHGLFGVVFHDSLSPEFTEQYSLPNIQFIKVDSSVFNNSNNDLRFLVYLDFLRDHYFKKVLMTDLCDVMFLKNPFDFIDSPEKLYIGSETRKIKNSMFCVELFKQVYPEFKYWDMTILNAGIAGGYHGMILEFLEKFASELTERPQEKENPLNMDMAIFNHVVYTYFNDRYVTGHPLHTEFKKGDVRNPEAYIVHK